MTQPPTGEIPSFSPDDEFNDFLEKVITDDIERQGVELDEAQRVSWLTEKLKNSPGRVVCLSYPDGTRNPTGLALFEAGQIDEIPIGYNSEDVIADEEVLYSIILELLRTSDDPNHPDFSNINENKQIVISLWMQLWSLPFTSNWVTFLRDTLPGGEVSYPDMEQADKLIREADEEQWETEAAIATILTDEYNEGPWIDGVDIRDIAKHYIESAIDLICDPLSAGSMPKGELNYRLRQLENKFAIPAATQLECLKICAAMNNCDLGDLA